MRCLTLFLAALCLASCGETFSDPSAVQVRDSSGVRIVSIPDHEPPMWTIDSIPFVDIGTIGGEDGQDLALPWASRRLPDGRIVISNAGTVELRFYRVDGTFIEAVGGSGEGPGEFGMVGAIHVGRGDTIVVSDTRQPRLNLYGTDGAFARTITIEPLEGRLPRLRGLVHDTIAVYRVPYYGRSGGVSRMVRDTFFVFSRPLNGGPTVPVGRFLASEKFNQVMPNGVVAGWNLPFARGFFAACTRELLWIAVSDRYELLGYDPVEGTLRQIIRLGRAAKAVEDTDRDRFFDHQLADVENANEERMYREVHRIIEFPPTMPALADLVSDSDDNLWVQDYDVPWSDASRRWRVFDPVGRMVAMVRMPHGLDVHDIGSDYVMGLWHDELDVEHIRVYRLARGS